MYSVVFKFTYLVDNPDYKRAVIEAKDRFARELGISRKVAEKVSKNERIAASVAK